MALISHPFRVQPNGQVAVEEDLSDQYMAERIALYLTIGPGERPLIPEFGIGDLAYEGLTQPDLENQMDMFDVPVIINEVEETVRPDGSLDYTVAFEVETGEF